MTAPLWMPTPQQIDQARITAFVVYVNQRYAAQLDGDYHSLHQWSLHEPEKFWHAVWHFGEIVGSGDLAVVLQNAGEFPGARWFPDARLNFAENLLRRRDSATALVSLLENGSRQEIGYAELYRQVAHVAASLRAMDVVAGDRVAGFMPNIAEAVIAMLASVSIGAVWSSCSPDFGIRGVMDRFGQIQPKVLFATDGYFYNGKTCDSLERVASIAQQIASIERVVIVPLVDASVDVSGIDNASLLADFVDQSASDIDFNRLPFDHPLYIMYSSGTTGAPKCIVHGAGGTLLQHVKEHQLHVDLRQDDVFFYFTTCGWMMWNWLVSGLATGATLILYDGSPFAAEGNLLLDAIDNEGITAFGTSPKFLSTLEKASKKPARTHSLATLRTVLSTGSPLSAENFAFVYRDIKSDVCLSSISGGTDILSCFVGGCPILPVYAGEIQAPGLGMAVEIWDENGACLQGEKGELICAQAFPSAPLGFWNDPQGRKYQEAYFSRFHGVWAQGDYGEVTEHGGFIIHGRSDAVLNPGGVRIGTAEIYRQVEMIDDVVDSVVIGQEWRGDVRVVLFVVLRTPLLLDDDLRATIRNAIRHNTTPRHVPAKIIQITDIPRTLSGKIVEVAVRNVVHRQPVNNTDALANPAALDQFRDLPELTV